VTHAEHRPSARTGSVTGAVLAGGRSRRMGADKRTMDVAGQALLTRAIESLGAVADEILVIVAEGDETTLADLAAGATFRTDLEPGLGPLGGLATALTRADADVVLVVPGDHPTLSVAVLQRLLDLLVEDQAVDAALLGTSDRGPQPLLGAYRRRALAAVQGLLDAGERRARMVVDVLPHAVLAEAAWRPLDPEGRTTIDLDTPEDVRAFPPWSTPPTAPPSTPPTAPPSTPRPAPHHLREARTPVVRVRPGGSQETDDLLVGEEPLELRAAGPGQEPVTVFTTLRTPGNEADLALGWLVADGLLAPEDGPRVEVSFADPHLAARPEDTVTVRLPRPLDLRAVAVRHALATASCGVCGRASIDELAQRCAPIPVAVPADAPMPWSSLAALPERMRAAQSLFATTGGLHGTGLFTLDGALVTVREDVGRHNSLDAAIGVHVRRGQLPLHGFVAVLSGRLGFELVAKAATAGIPIVAAVGAASDLAVRTADRLGITLVGFLRDGSGTIYTHPHRLDPNT
jgi:FdhD protein